jgi:hypothetical protein
MITLAALHGYTASVKYPLEILGRADTACEVQGFICIVISSVREDV